MGGTQVIVSVRAPGSGALFVMAVIMRETNEDVFEREAKQCHDWAERAVNKSDRDFWLRLA
jgi:hypothetical protein